MGWVGNARPRPPYPRERSGAHYMGSWVDLKPGLDGCEKIPHQNSIPGPSNPYTVEFNTNQKLVYGQFILLGCGAIYIGIWVVTLMRGFLLLLNHHEERSRKVCIV